jgi:hypothetical protein
MSSTSSSAVDGNAPDNGVCDNVVVVAVVVVSDGRGFALVVGWLSMLTGGRACVPVTKAWMTFSNLDLENY